MYNQIYKCNQIEMLKLVPVMNRMYFCTDSRVLYKDFSNSREGRLRFNAVILYSDSDRLNNIKPEIGKFYYVENTNSLWLFDGRWVIKIGESAKYNMYTSGDGVDDAGNITPVSSSDYTITNEYGDRIIDNNGLLGNGAVVVRDYNRLLRASLEANIPTQEIHIKSHLDNGFVFIPNAHLGYNELTKSYGALHLGVDRWYNETGVQEFQGAANYYGEWNNHGDMYVVKSINPSDIEFTPDYIPNSTNEIVKIKLECTCHKTVNVWENGEDIEQIKPVRTYIVIRPLSSAQAIAQIISVYDDSKSVVEDDQGNLIFTHTGNLIDNTYVDCTRRLFTTPNSIEAVYEIPYYIDNDENKDVIPTIRHHKNLETGSESMIVSALWAESTLASSYEVKIWRKEKVLTDTESTSSLKCKPIYRIE